MTKYHLGGRLGLEGVVATNQNPTEVLKFLDRGISKRAYCKFGTSRDDEIITS